MDSLTLFYDTIEQRAPDYEGRREQAILQLLKEGGAPIIQGVGGLLSCDSSFHWFREFVDWDPQSCRVVLGVKVGWQRPDPEASDWPAHTAYQADMGYRIAINRGFREATGDLRQHLQPGDYIECRYHETDSTPYSVVYQVRKISLDRQCGHIAWHLTLGTHHGSSNGYLNDLVWCNGRIRHLFANNRNVVRRVDHVPPAFCDPKAAGTQLSLGL